MGTLTTEDHRELHRAAQKKVVELLKVDDRTDRYDIIPYRASDLAIAALGPDRAHDLHGRTYSIANELLSTRDNGLRAVESIRRSLQDAESGFKGGRSINSLGILQGEGPRLDVYGAQFHLLVEMTIDAIHSEEAALREAIMDGDEAGIRAAAQTIADEREREEARMGEKARERREAEAERNRLRCTHESFGRGRAYSKSRCEKAGRFIVKLDDGTERRYCGTHLKSAVYGGIRVGTSLHVDGKLVGVVEIVDTKA